MTDYDDMDDERAAHIDEGIDQVHRFMRNVIDDPTPLQIIPDGSELQFRTVLVDGSEMQLTAHRQAGSGAAWTALVTSCEPIEHPATSTHDALPSQHATRCAEHRYHLLRVAATSQAALDAVEAVVRSSATSVVSR